LRSSSEKFDLIVDDCFNLVEDFSPEEDIFGALKDHLTENVGVCCSLVYRHIFDNFVFSRTAEQLIKHHKTIISLVAVPEYPGVLHLLTMWGKAPLLNQALTSSQNTWHKQTLSLGTPCGQIFDPAYCGFYLYLPPYIKQIMNRE
jgi:hypothetical protein